MRIQPERLKPILRVEFVFIACVICILLFTPHAWGQAPKKDTTKNKPDAPLEVHGTVEIGVRANDIDGDHPAKFEEARNVPNGFFIQKLKLNLDSADSPYSFRLWGTEIRERDQRNPTCIGLRTRSGLT